MGYIRGQKSTEMGYIRGQKRVHQGTENSTKDVPDKLAQTCNYCLTKNLLTSKELFIFNFESVRRLK